MGSVARRAAFARRQEEYNAQLAASPPRSVAALQDVRRWIETFRRQGARLLDALLAGATVEQVTAEQHFLAIAAVHALRAVHRANRLGWGLPVAPSGYLPTLHALRNVYEHWEDFTPWWPDGCFPVATSRTTARTLVKRYPGANPLNARFDGRLGGCIPLEELDAHFELVLQKVHEADSDRVPYSLVVESSC